MNDSAGHNFSYDLTDEETKCQLYQQYMSLINFGSPAGYDQRNNANRFCKDYINEFSNSFDEYWKRSYDELLVLNLSPDMNFIQDMDSPKVSSSGESECEILFNDEIQNAVLIVSVLHDYEYTSQGSGLQKRISIEPNNLRNG
jgi:hypothetical protein